MEYPTHVVLYTDSVTGEVECRKIIPSFGHQFFINYHKGVGDVDVIVKEINQVPQGFFEYKKAWVIQKSEISSNMVKAKEILLSKLREERKKHFQETDSLIIEAFSRNKDNSIIKDRQIYLRNITETPAIANATTIDELLNVNINSWEKPDVVRLKSL
jgi:hypothetical protein